MRNWTRRYDVVCMKGYYVGAGNEWSTGDIYTSTFTKEEAEYIKKLLNSDTWAENAWTVEETPI